MNIARIGQSTVCYVQVSPCSLPARVTSDTSTSFEPIPHENHETSSFPIVNPCHAVATALSPPPVPATTSPPLNLSTLMLGPQHHHRF